MQRGLPGIPRIGKQCQQLLCSSDGSTRIDGDCGWHREQVAHMSRRRMPRERAAEAARSQSASLLIVPPTTRMWNRRSPIRERRVFIPAGKNGRVTAEIGTPQRQTLVMTLPGQN